MCRAFPLSRFNLASLCSVVSQWPCSVVTWHLAYGSDSSGVCKRLRKVLQIVASGRAFAAVTSYGSVVTWGLPKMVADTAMVRQQLYDVKSVTAAAQGAFAARRHDGSVVTWGLKNLLRATEVLKLRD